MVMYMFLVTLISSVIVLIDAATYMQFRNASRECFTGAHASNKTKQQLYGCMNLCIAKKLKKCDDKGKPIASSYPPSQQTIIAICDETTKHTDPCLRASSIARCVHFKDSSDKLEMLMSCARSTNTSATYTTMVPRYSNQNPCFHRCLYTKWGYLKASGEVDVASLEKKIANATAVDEWVKTCAKRKFANETCVNSTVIGQCLRDNLFRLLTV